MVPADPEQLGLDFVNDDESIVDVNDRSTVSVQDHVAEDAVETVVPHLGAEPLGYRCVEPIGITVGGCRRRSIDAEVVAQQADTSGDEDAVGSATIGRAGDC
jgi:hypothetical protein